MHGLIAIKISSWSRVLVIMCLTAVVAAGTFGTGGPWPVALAASGACPAPATNLGTQTIPLTVASAGPFRIWSRIMASNTVNNSYSLDIDGKSCFVVGDNAASAPSGQWVWADYQSGTTTNKIDVTLTAGAHTLKLIGREPSVKLDRVMALADTTCTPTGTGNNCAVAPDTIAPVVTLTAPPSGATVTGASKVTASATDNTAVTKVEFYVNGQLQGTSTTAPYALSWNTAALTNGSYTVLAKAYDAAGNIGSDSVAVIARNGDTQAPTTPIGVKASANAAAQVSLVWTGSTDNVAVASYSISRGRTVIGSSTVPSYTDTTARPATSYSYTVRANDAAGNSSAASVAANVTTPSLADTSAPSVPANLTVGAVSASQINLAWSQSTDNVGVTGYDVYRSSTGSAAVMIATGVVTTQFGDSGLKANTAYTYSVAARDAAGNISSKSVGVTATTRTVVAPSPTATPTRTPNPTSTPTRTPSITQTPVATPINTPTPTPTRTPSSTPNSTPRATPLSSATPTSSPVPGTIDPQTGVIRGQITGKWGRPLAGVSISLWVNGNRYLATTNRNGIYRIDHLPAGHYSLTLSSRGYHKRTVQVNIHPAGTTIRNLTLSQR